MVRPTIETATLDVPIPGGGGAGLLAARHSYDAAPELSIAIAVKGVLGKCGCTRMVQAATMAPSTRRIRSSGISATPSRAASGSTTRSWPGPWWTWAVERVMELEIRWGCFFDRAADGRAHQQAFAGQSFDRTVDKGRLAGIEIINHLAEQVLARPILRPEDHRALDLLPARAAAWWRAPCCSTSAAGCSAWSAPVRCCWRPAAGRLCTATTPLGRQEHRRAGNGGAGRA